VNFRRHPLRLPTFCFLVFLAGCAKPDRPANRTEHLGGKTLSETISENAPHLLSIEGVVKIVPGDCGIDSCIKVVVDKKTEILVSQIPMMLETWQVDVVETAK
jgi:hypothetical protein